MDREQIFKQLNEYCGQRYVEIGQRRLDRPVIKSYVFETARFARQSNHEFEILGAMHHIDEQLFQINDEKGPIGYLEDLNRFKVFYTFLPTSEIETAVTRIVRESQFLDSLWLSGEIFRVLFDLVVRAFSPRRFLRTAMGYRPVFEDFQDVPDYQIESSDHYDEDLEEEFETLPTSRLQISNRLERVRHLIEIIQPAPEFRNMVMLRIPATSAAGGHEFYSNGKVTNRSSDFMDHRNSIMSVVRMYKGMTERIEDMTWLRFRCDNGPVNGFAGNPVVIRFEKPLDPGVFGRFLDLTFEKGKGPFRLWGNLLERGVNCYHFYGLDLHLVNEIFLELTPSRFLVFLPEGTCGNTVHRLVTNVQRYLTSEIEVYIGDKPYMELAREVFSSIAFEQSSESG